MADVRSGCKVRHVVGCHEKRAFQAFAELRACEELLDVTLKVNDKEIKAHRIVLAACSPYFRAMLTTGFAESYMSTISLQDCDADSVLQIIEYFYSCKLTITQDNIEGILFTASLFELPEVVRECGEFMVDEIQLENCLGIHCLASQYSLGSLKSKVDNFISWNFMDLCVEEEFSLIPGFQLNQIISQDSLHVNGEDDVFEALMAWYQEDETRINKHKDLMKHIRFTCMDPDYIEEVVLCDETFSQVPDWESLAEAALEILLSPRQKMSKECKEKPRQSPYVLYLVPELFDSKVETFDMETGACSEVSQMVETSGTAVVVDDNLYLLVGGGLMVDRYHPKKNLWIRVVDGMKESEYVACGGMKSIFVIGGGKRAKVLDLAAKTWERLPMMSLRRSYHSAVVCHTDVYVTGGITPPGDQATTTVECYSTESKKWNSCSSMIFPRFRHEMAVLNDCIYAIGGCDKLASSSKSVEVFDPKLNCWSLVAAMNHPRRDFAVGVLQDIIFVFGGGGTTTIEQYSSDADKWTVAGNLNKRWSNFRCVTYPYFDCKPSPKAHHWQEFHRDGN